MSDGDSGDFTVGMPEQTVPPCVYLENSSRTKYFFLLCINVNTVI